MKNYELHTISVNDVLHTLRECERNARYDGMFEHMLTFAGELTGISEDLLMELMYQDHTKDVAYVPCEYVSSWDGFRDVSSPAKYDPVRNKVYDVETANLSEEELAECEFLVGEYMILSGIRFVLEDRSADDTWSVKAPDPLSVVSEKSDLSSHSSLETLLQSAVNRAVEASPVSFVKGKEVNQEL